jgi:dihydrolipoamide dehydrogenase
VDKFDLVVLGGGPGGYPAAIRASQLGLSTALVEANRLGGECTNYGCIPTKSMIRPVELLSSLSRLPFVKLSYELDYQAYMDWVKGVASRVSEGVGSLLRRYNVEVFNARGWVAEPGVLELSDGRRIGYSKLVVATGTDPASIPGLDFDGALIHNNRTILEVRRKPSRVLVIGAGYIGVEFANVMAKLGVDVYIVEVMDRVLPAMDDDFSRLMSRRLSRMGVKVYTSTRIVEVEKREGYVKAKLSNNVEVEADLVLVAVGRKPNTKGLGLERLGVSLDERGYVRVDGRMAASTNVYASGDVTGPPLLAHRAFAQAIVAAENAAGLKSEFDARAIPSVVFTDPELVSVGLTEVEAKNAGYRVSTVKLPIGGLARATIEDSLDGFIKIVYEESSKAVIGIHLAAPHASEIAGELGLAIEMGATLEDLASTIHPHPTISEAVQEVAELALGKPKHFKIGR